MNKKRKAELEYAAWKGQIAAMQIAAMKFLEFEGWDVGLAADVGIQSYPGSGKDQYEVFVRFLGKKKKA